MINGIEIERLKNIEYLIYNLELEIKKIKKEIRFFKIAKYFFITEILIGLNFLIFSSTKYREIGLMSILLGIFSLLLSILVLLFDKKKLKMQSLELSKLQNLKDKI